MIINSDYEATTKFEMEIDSKHVFLIGNMNTNVDKINIPLVGRIGRCSYHPQVYSSVNIPK